MSDMLEAVPDRLSFPDDFEKINDGFYERGWTDGFPVVPPTESRVAAMLEGTTFRPGDVLGVVGPMWAEATVEKVAVNAVMAGCRPKHFPAVIAAVQAITAPEFNLYSIQATTNPAAPLLVFGGPICASLDLHGGNNALGQGFRGNATIGRAIRLVMLNVGGGRPGKGDKATLGFPGKYSFCVAENEAESPWAPYRTRHGIPKGHSAVTAFGASGTTNVLDYGSKCASDLLQLITGTITILGSNNVQLGGGPLILLSPEHAQILHEGGFRSAELVERYFYEQARIPVGRFPEAFVKQILLKRRPLWATTGHPAEMIPVADSVQEVLVVVTGGVGPHSQVLHSFGEGTRAITRPIVHRDGSPVGP